MLKVITFDLKPTKWVGMWILQVNIKEIFTKSIIKQTYFPFFFQVTAILRVCRHRSKTCVCQLSQIHPYFSFFVPPQGTRMYFYKRTQKPVPLGTSNTLFHTAPEAEPRYKLKSIMKQHSCSYALTISRDFYPLCDNTFRTKKVDLYFC